MQDEIWRQCLGFEGRYSVSSFGRVRTRPSGRLLPGSAMTCGIYSITCSLTGKTYIGSSADIEQRLARHFRELRSGAHDNPKMLAAFRKHGENVFTASVLEECDVGATLIHEQRHLDLWFRQSPHLLLNIARNAERPPSFHEMTEDAQRRIREATRARSFAMHRDPVFAAARDARIDRLNSDPQFVARHIERARSQMIRLNSDPSFRKANSERSKALGTATFTKLHRDPGFKARHLARIEKLNADPESRRRCIEATRAANSKRCRCTTAGGETSEFDSTAAAAKALGIKRSAVSGWCRGAFRARDGSTWGYL